MELRQHRESTDHRCRRGWVTTRLLHSPHPRHADPESVSDNSEVGGPFGRTAVEPASAAGTERPRGFCFCPRSVTVTQPHPRRFAPLSIQQLFGVERKSPYAARRACPSAACALAEAYFSKAPIWNSPPSQSSRCQEVWTRPSSLNSWTSIVMMEKGRPLASNPMKGPTWMPV